MSVLSSYVPETTCMPDGASDDLELELRIVVNNLVSKMGAVIQWLNHLPGPIRISDFVSFFFFIREAFEVFLLLFTLSLN